MLHKIYNLFHIIKSWNCADIGIFKNWCSSQFFKTSELLINKLFKKSASLISPVKKEADFSKSFTKLMTGEYKDKFSNYFTMFSRFHNFLTKRLCNKK